MTLGKMNRSYYWRRWTNTYACEINRCRAKQKREWRRDSAS